jgi:uncharacterized LabA/DUF88 family protein
VVSAPPFFEELVALTDQALPPPVTFDSPPPIWNREGAANIPGEGVPERPGLGQPSLRTRGPLRNGRPNRLANGPTDDLGSDADSGLGRAGPPTEYEPLPPPTKRKAPRLSSGPPRIAAPGPTENAVDWALGRAPAMPEDRPADESEIVPSRRRRSRRGRRGQGGGGDRVLQEDSLADEAANGSQLAQAPLQAARMRPAQPSPMPVQPRGDTSRSQLSAFEGLVARQNVVLDSLLAKVSSFTAIERSLLAIERRLATQTPGAAGTATPRVGIFVDVPNIIYAADRIGVTIDFGRLLNMLTRGRELVRASAYAPISDDMQQRWDTQKFVQPFVHRGFRIVTKPLKRFSDGTMKGNFDVELAMDVLTMSDRLDVVSLVSGDGDFSRLVEIVGSKGLRVEVVAFGSSTSAELRAICDDYIDISDRLSDLI